MKTTKEMMLKAIELSNANQEMDIKFFTEDSEMLGEYSWVEHRITSVEITDYYVDCGDGMIYTDEDTIREKIGEEFENRPDLTDEEIEEKITQIYKKNTKKVIAISTGF